MEQRANNKGFSLMEVLVVIAVAMILTGFAALSITVVHNANVSKAARSLDSLLNTARTQSIAKGRDAGCLTLTMENGRLYGEIGSSGEREEICNKLISVYYIKNLGSTSYTMSGLTDQFTDGDSYTFYFEQSGIVEDNSPGDNYAKVIFHRGNRTVEVILYKETGKHEIRMVN